MEGIQNRAALNPPRSAPGAWRHALPTPVTAVRELNCKPSFNLERPAWDQERTNRVETALYYQ